MRSWLTTFRSCTLATTTAKSDTTTEVPRYEVFQKLAAELQFRRPGVHGSKMAELLLRFEEGRDLVGVDGNRAIYYELASRSLVAVRYDKHGVYQGHQEVVKRELTNPNSWVEVYRDGLEWVHPRY